MFWSKSISHKILTTLSFVVLPLAVGLVYIMSNLLYSHTDKTMLDLLEPMARTVAKSVEGRLHLLVDRLYLIKDNDAFHHFPIPKANIERTLRVASEGIEFLWIGLYDQDGALIAGNESCPRNISSRQKFPRMRKTNNLVIEDTSIGEAGLEVVIGLPVQVKGVSPSSQATYYLVGCYSYNILADVLSSVNIRATNAVFIINKEGNFIAHKDHGEIFGNNSIVNHLGEEITRKMTSGQTGAESITTKDGVSFVGFAPVHGTAWSIGVEMLRGEFTATAEQRVMLSAIGTIAMLLIFSFALYLFFRKSLSAPLQAITESARKLSVGELETNLPRELLERKDEIGQLGTTFISMTYSITRVIRDLDTLTNAARVGFLNRRVASDSYSGYYDRIISGMNAALDVFRMYLDSIPNAMMLLDGDQQCIHANKPMKRLVKKMRFTDNEQEFLHLLFNAGDQHSFEEITAYFTEEANGNVLHSNITVMEPDGRDVFYVLNIQRIEANSVASGDDTQSECFMLMLSDVTQLGKAKIAAEAASKAKGDFLSCMSHEMRTPMNAILGMASIAKSSNDLERKEYCLDKITDASRHLLGIINDILDMSKIEAQKFELSQTAFSFEDMLRQAVNVVSFTAEKKDQDFVIDIDSSVPQRIISDEQRLAQVIANLLGNAVKFTPEEGSISLKARTSENTEKGCVLRIEVHDTGIGISQEQQKNLFASFGQADNSISRKFGGTGLGLAISKNIIELMGGCIWVDSEEGQGSTFIFEVTVAPASQQGYTPHASAQADYSALRVLVVDTSPEILANTHKKLRYAGVLHCTTTTNVDEAFALVQEQKALPYSLALIDAKCGHSTGMALAAEISRTSHNRTAIVMTTGVTPTGKGERGKGATFGSILHKPIFMGPLLEKLYACLTQDPALAHTKDSSNTALETGAATNSTERQTPDFSNHKILIAEDIEINREIIAALLEPTNVSITFAENGREAIEAFSKEPEGFSIILMDLQMPEVDGLMATEAIRTSGLPRAKDIPIIAMTANVFQDDIDRSKEAGMNAHLGKPIDIQEFFATMKKYIPYRI